MPQLPEPGRRPLAFLPLAISALCGLLIARMAVRDARYLVPVGLIAVLVALPPMLARWRLRRIFLSGDVERVLGTWSDAVLRVRHPETMEPLMQATAYAAYGWLEAGRRALDRAAKGPAWDAALEQRLFVETFLDTFEGERERALLKAEALVSLPVAVPGWFARRRVKMLRRAIRAFARAFAHAAQPGDERLLEEASSASPLVHWAMRYAAAIVAVDRGERTRALSLLEGAPDWPKSSAFQHFHHELVSHAGA
ncbi:MAG: hypothetical protein U0169_18920 [Polyangiaceae bacterium]